MKKTLTTLSMIMLSACGAKQSGSNLDAVAESKAFYSPGIPTQNEKASSLAGTNQTLLDVRGVGDSAYTHGGAKGARYAKPLGAGFSGALKRIDPSKKILKGDLNFINWEAVLGERCNNIRQSVSYYFFSHPDNITMAYNHGFNLFGLANNHSQDCNKGQAFENSANKHGPLMSEEVMKHKANHYELLWHGTGRRPFEANSKVFKIKGNDKAVALGNLSLITWDIPNSSNINVNQPGAFEKAKTLLKSLQQSDSEFRVLSIHTQDNSGSRGEGKAFKLMKRIAQAFVESYNGNVVFVHGPHTWAGVKVVERRDGRKGVIFSSLGNFIHQGLSSNGDNYIGRALFDMDTHQLSEVQVIPFRNSGSTVKFQNRKSGPMANFSWRKTGNDGVSRFYARF